MIEVGKIASMSAVFGSDVAQQAWDIEDVDLAGLLPGEHSVATLHDVRAQFARWASNSPSRVFASLADAWNAFASPKLGRAHPVVLLPASTCYRCANVRGLTGQRSDPSCVLCQGTGRRKPSAFQALTATPDSFCTSFSSQPAAAADTQGTDAAEDSENAEVTGEVEASAVQVSGSES